MGALYLTLGLVSLFVSPAIALFMGILVAIIAGNPFMKQTKMVSKHLLQYCVVGLGFSMNLHDSLAAGRDGMTFTIISVVTVMVVGVFVGRALKVSRKGGYLIAAGTAICGGSAIAAVSPVIDADESDTSLSLAVIFILNAIALFIFPPLGRIFEMTQEQFGVWAAIAIHDTSSVVGAASVYGEEALAIATTVKLTRALWIIPLSIISTLLFKGSGKKIQIPYFIICFIAAMLLNTYIELPIWFTETIYTLSHKGLSLTLFLIGAALTLSVIKSAGARPLIQAITLWFVISILSFSAVMYN